MYDADNLATDLAPKTYGAGPSPLQPVLDDVAMLLIMVIGIAGNNKPDGIIAGNKEPDGIVLCTPGGKHVQALFTHLLDCFQCVLIRGSEGSQHLRQWTIFLLLVDVVVDLVYVRKGV